MKIHSKRLSEQTIKIQFQKSKVLNQKKTNIINKTSKIKKKPFLFPEHGHQEKQHEKHIPLCIERE